MRPIHHPHRLNLIPPNIILQASPQISRTKSWTSIILRRKMHLRKRLLSPPLPSPSRAPRNSHLEQDIVRLRISRLQRPGHDIFWTEIQVGSCISPRGVYNLAFVSLRLLFHTGKGGVPWICPRCPRAYRLLYRHCGLWLDVRRWRYGGVGLCRMELFFARLSWLCLHWGWLRW